MVRVILRVGLFQTNPHSSVQRCFLSTEACHMCVYPRFSSAALFERNCINNKPNSVSCEDDIVGLHEKSFMLCREHDYTSMAWKNCKIISLIVWSLFVLCLGVQSWKNLSELYLQTECTVDTTGPAPALTHRRVWFLWSCLCCGCVKTHSWSRMGLATCPGRYLACKVGPGFTDENHCAFYDHLPLCLYFLHASWKDWWRYSDIIHRI